MFFSYRMHYRSSDVGSNIAPKMALKSCSKPVFAPSLGNGKSPLFFRCRVLTAVNVDQSLLVFAVIEGAFFLV
jgi:hypothetical protein